MIRKKLVAETWDTVARNGGGHFDKKDVLVAYVAALLQAGVQPHELMEAGALAEVDQEDRRRRRLFADEAQGSFLPGLNPDRERLEGAIPLGEGLRVRAGDGDAADFARFKQIIVTNNINQQSAYIRRYRAIEEVEARLQGTTMTLQDLW